MVVTGRLTPMPENEFVTKRDSNIKPAIAQELPMPQEPLPSEYTVVKEALVTLGDDPDHTYRMLEVELTSGQPITILSSMVDAPADQICLLYRYRWTIEIVFRWLKQLLQLDHLMSHDPTGIVWGLLVVANQDSSNFSPKQFWR